MFLSQKGQTGLGSPLALKEVVRSRSRGAEIKLPPGAGGEITNCGSGSSSGSFYLPQTLINFIEKIMVAEEFVVNCFNFNLIT
jgi:hypothetical protein